jgi:hypothetical protein
MRKVIAVAVFLMVGVIGSGYAQEIPEEVIRALDNYLKDSTAVLGPLQHRRRGTIPADVQIKDLRFRVLKTYNFKNISLRDYPDTVALSEVIEPTGWWHVLVMAHNKPLYEFSLDHELRATNMAIPAPIGSEFKCKMWIPLLEKYPESAGITPVIVGFYDHTINRSLSFLYFEQLGSRKIYHCTRGSYDPRIDSLFTGTIENLDDSRILVEYLKKHDIVKEGERLCPRERHRRLREERMRPQNASGATGENRSEGRFIIGGGAGEDIADELERMRRSRFGNDAGFRKGRDQ